MSVIIVGAKANLTSVVPRAGSLLEGRSERVRPSRLNFRMKFRHTGNFVESMECAILQMNIQFARTNRPLTQLLAHFNAMHLS
ncbi:hypothetical protein GCM10025779_20870 [Arthrobacter cryoconiti]